MLTNAQERVHWGLSTSFTFSFFTVEVAHRGAMEKKKSEDDIAQVWLVVELPGQPALLHCASS
jgi:hypothetical protein